MTLITQLLVLVLAMLSEGRLGYVTQSVNAAVIGHSCFTVDMHLNNDKKILCYFPILAPLLLNTAVDVDVKKRF